MSTHNIESSLIENRVFEPSEAFKQQANVNDQQYQAMLKKADEDNVGFWVDLAKEKIDWATPFTKGLDDANPPFYKWFADGELNISYNCIDRHLADKGDKVAIIFEADDGRVEKYTYQQLFAEVSRLANALIDLGLKKGERVIIYMPMIPQAVFAMQA